MAVNKVETVDIVRDLVTLLVTELTGSGAWVENVGENTFTMPICKTYWLKAQDVITIDGTDYTISSVIRDTSVTVTTSVAPNGLTFFLEAPSFYHGTIVQTNQELSQDSKDVSERSPMAYLFRDLTDTFFDDSNLLDRETSIRLFFLHDTNFQDFTTDLADEETLEPMRSMAYFFVEEILKKSKLIGKIEDYDIRDYLKFGVENASGYTENIFNDNFSGVELTITLPILRKYLCECDDVRAKIKYIDSDSVLKSSNYGSLIVCTPNGDATEINVSNSNDSYSVDTLLDLELPNINFTDSDGITTSVPSMEDITATLCATITNTSFIYKTGQDTSYQSGDLIGDDNSNGVDFFTLSYNNGFGNTSRFTLKDGTQLTSSSIYGDSDLPIDSVFVDWSTWNIEDSEVLCWLVNDLTSSTWSTAITNGQVAPSGEPSLGWHLPNIAELISVLDFGGNSTNNKLIMQYFQGHTNVNRDLWTSTTNPNNTGNAFYLANQTNISAISKGNSNPYIKCRYYTLTELGL